MQCASLPPLPAHALTHCKLCPPHGCPPSQLAAASDKEQGAAQKKVDAAAQRVERYEARLREAAAAAPAALRVDVGSLEEVGGVFREGSLAQPSSRGGTVSWALWSPQEEDVWWSLWERQGEDAASLEEVGGDFVYICCKDFLVALL